MTANEPPTADPMPEPTPDRAVSPQQLLHDYWAGMVGGDLERASCAYNEIIRRLSATERPAAMPEPTPPGEWSCPICGQSFKSDCTYPVGRAPICGRDAVPMVPVNRELDTTNTEPTPDRAVTELSNEELLNALVYQATEHGSNVNDAFFKGSVHRSTLAAITAYRVELLRRLSATERPTDGTVIEIARSQIPALSDALCWGIEHIENEIEQMPVGEDRDDLFNDLDGMIQLRDDLQQQCNAALSAAGDGGDCE